MDRSKSMWIGIVTFLFALLAAAGYVVSVARAQHSQKAPTTSQTPNGGEIFGDLRNLALSRTAGQVGFRGDKSEAYGVILDWGMEGEAVTIVAFAEGDASMYTSVGGGVIGGFAHDGVRQAARSAVAIAGRASIPRSDDTSLPGNEKARITVLTGDGRRSTVAAVEALGEGKHELSPVFYALNDVVSALRRAGSE